MEYSVPNDLPYKMMDDPNPYDTVENLERHLAGVRAMPDFKFKKETIAEVEQLIALRKKLEAESKTQELAPTAAPAEPRGWDSSTI
jgi:hypothetical protein